ncbi:MAG: diguanylate cyclase [Omnitrophica WOR_2 bacterium RIFOXYB2_FULL_45_11]|nr:MAG: diguanylate cyclase [Omnitrophica WOR_2 bacterium RIFOXYB2_FULL_45_11]OGX61041.1 MAG: diguanylate cyclase [Omnitrophica WOR_2 bacterium RIFOXYC2_FULL_45_15]
MLTYIIKRLLGMFPLLWGIITISFMVIHLAPGKPSALTEAMNPRVSSEVRERLNKLYGLDRPLTIQYFDWCRKIITLDFGASFIDGRPVIRKIGERLPLTVFINITSLFIILFLGIIIGLKCASQAGSLYDHFMSLLVFIGFAMPGFWLSLLLMDFLGLKLRWLPISGITSLDFEYFTFWGKAGDLLKHLALPLFVSCFGGLAGISRYIRQNTLEILKTPYIRAARARGLTRSAVLIQHALPNTLLPVVTILGLSIPGLIGGSVIFESIFALPGVGRLFYEAVMARDYPMIMAELVIGAALTLWGNFLADIAYSYVDPRIRYKR